MDKKWLLIGAVVAAIAWGGTALYQSLRTGTPRGTGDERQQVASSPSTTSPTTMKFTSSAFAQNQSMPPAYTCDGDNVSPSLTISDVPADLEARVKSFALIVDDPDAASGTWVHWVIWNIDPNVRTIESGSVPIGVAGIIAWSVSLAVQGTTSFGATNWGGPCPPSGTHRYFFKLYALDTVLNLPTTTNKDGLLDAINSHILAQTELIGLYQRAK